MYYDTSILKQERGELASKAEITAWATGRCMLGRKEGVYKRECRTGSHLCRPNRHDVLCGYLFKVVDKPGCLLVVCKFLCSVTLTRYICIRGRVWSKVVDTPVIKWKARLVRVMSMHIPRIYVICSSHTYCIHIYVEDGLLTDYQVVYTHQQTVIERVV